MYPFPQYGSSSQYPSIRTWGFSRFGSGTMPMEAINCCVSFNVTAHIPSCPINAPWRISRDSFNVLWGAHPALFPKLGFWQQAKNASASFSWKGRSSRRFVSIFGHRAASVLSASGSFLYTHSKRFPSGSSTTLSKYPSPEVRGSPAMVYPSERISSVKRRISSLLGNVNARCVSPRLFSSIGVFCTSARLINSRVGPSSKEIKYDSNPFLGLIYFSLLVPPRKRT